MHELVNAILNRDKVSIRSILRNKPELKKFKSKAGFSIFELAEKTADYLILASLYKETKSQISDPENVLSGILSTLSHDYFCAHYISGIEYSVWHCLQNNGEWPPEYDDLYTPLDQDTLADIGYIVEMTGSWYAEDIGLISLQEWLKKY